MFKLRHKTGNASNMMQPHIYLSTSNKYKQKPTMHKVDDVNCPRVTHNTTP